jgi:hypothetical protein
MLNPLDLVERALDGVDLVGSGMIAGCSTLSSVPWMASIVSDRA